jgi:hypothetical protein
MNSYYVVLEVIKSLIALTWFNIMSHAKFENWSPLQWLKCKLLCVYCGVWMKRRWSFMLVIPNSGAFLETMGVYTFYHVSLWFCLSDSSLIRWFKVLELIQHVGWRCFKGLDLHSKGHWFESQPRYPLCPTLSLHGNGWMALRHRKSSQPLECFYVMYELLFDSPIGRLA